MTLTDSMYDYRFERNKAHIVDKCRECGTLIYEGEEYYDIDNIIVCEECIDHFKRS